jgi:hypothetical protein
MDHATFEKIFDAQVQACRDTLVRKGAEYSPIDRFSNFKIAASFQHETPQQALGGMLAKHIVSVYDLIDAPIGTISLAMWDEKLGDALNYLFLLKGLIVEQIEADLSSPINNIDPQGLNNNLEF